MDGIAFSMTTVKKGQPADTVNDKGRQIQITPPSPSLFPPTAKMLELALTLACNHPCYESRTLEQKGRTKTWLYVLLFFVLALLQTLPLFFSLLYCFYKSGYMLKLGIQDQHRHTQKKNAKTTFLSIFAPLPPRPTWMYISSRLCPP